MSDPTTLLLTDDEQSLVAATLTTLGQETTRIADPGEALRIAPSHELVIVDLQTGGVEFTRGFREDPAHAVTPILCVSPTDSVEDRIAFLEAGADDVIARPFDAREFEARLEALRLRFRRTKSLSSTGTTVVRAAGRPSLIVVFSPKGGVGTTTVAVNLAVALAGRGTGDVGLIDLDLLFGDVATFMNLMPRQSLVELARDEVALHDPALTRSFAEKHAASAVDVLAAPATPDGADLVAAEAIDALLTSATGAWATTVVDAGSHFDDLSRSALAKADVLLVPLSPDFPAVRAVHSLLDAFLAAGIAPKQTHFILNEQYAREMVRLREIEDAIGTKIALHLPYDAFLYLKAVNEGVPVVIGAPKSLIAERFSRLAGIVMGEVAPGSVEEKRKGLFGRG